MMRVIGAALVASSLGVSAMAAEPLLDGQMDAVTAGIGSRITLPYADLSAYRIPQPAPLPYADLSGYRIAPPVFPVVDIQPPVFPAAD